MNNGNFGLGNFGGGAFGGMGTVEVVLVHPIARNAIRVTSSQPLRRDDFGGFDSAINAENWALITIDPTIIAQNGDEVIPPGEFVPTRFPSIVGGVALPDEIDPLTIELFTDVDMEKKVRYQLVALRIVGEDGEPLVGPDIFDFRGLGFKQQNRARQPLEPFRDLDTLDGAFPGAFTFEPTSDIAVHGGVESLKKRIYRRIITNPGGFVHLPAYGAGVRVKALATSGRLAQIATDLAVQIQEEPDVQTANVQVEMGRPKSASDGLGVLGVSIRVTQVDNTNRVFTYSLPLDPL